MDEPIQNESQPITHEELLAASIAELIEEGEPSPPEWFSKAVNSIDGIVKTKQTKQKDSA